MLYYAGIMLYYVSMLLLCIYYAVITDMLDNTKSTAYILTGISRTGMLRYGYEMLRFAREMLRFARGKAEHQRKSTRANRNSILQKVRNLNF